MKKIIFTLIFFTILVTTLSSMVAAQTDSEIFEEGVSLYKKGEFQRAINTFTELFLQAPENVDGYRIRGSSFMKLTKYDLAIKDFEKTIKLAPDLNGVYSDLGTAWYYNKNYPKALEYYNLEIERGHQNHLVFFNRALCLEQLGKYDQALEDLSISLGLKADFYWALCYKGNLLVQKSNFSEAIAAYKAAIKVAGDDPYAKEKLALIKDKVKKPKQKQIVTQGWSLQSGAFRNPENAKKMKKQLIKNGFDTKILVTVDSDGREWHLVRSGFYPDKEAAQKAAPSLKKLGVDAVVRPADTW